MGNLKIDQKYKGIRKIEKRQIKPKKIQQTLPEQKQHVPKSACKNSWSKFFKL